MTESYENPLLNTIPDDDLDAMDAQETARPKGGSPLPKGRYTSYLTDWTTDTVPDHFAGPMAGQRRIRATFETEYDNRNRKLFVDLTDQRIQFEATADKPAAFVREYRLAGQLLKATGQRGKPLSDALEAARTMGVDLEVGVDTKKNRNVVYAIHSQVGG